MPELYPHQAEGVEWLRKTPRALLADDPGLGKTAQVLLAAVEPVLVVAPAMLRGVWESEVEKWRPGLDFTWVSYSSLCQRAGRKTLPRVRDEYARRWGTVVFDESHYLKNRQAKWTQAALQLAWQTERLYLVTGTPIPNWAHELHMTLRLLHAREDRRYTSYWRFIETWFRWWSPPYGPQNFREITGLLPGITWEEFATGNDLDRLMLRRRREDVLKDLPPLTEQWITVPMGTKQRKAYTDLKRDYCTWVEEAGEEVMAFSDGGLHIKLWQATTGLGTLTGVPGLEGSCKLDALKELVEERWEAPLVVFTYFRDTALSVVELAKKLGRRGGLIMGGMQQSDRDANVALFQRGGIDLLVGTIDCLAEGVTLTRSCTCIMLEESYRPHKNEQAPLRLLRIGQESPVTAIHVVTEDSLDQNIIARRNEKSREQNAALTAVEFARML